MGMREWPLPRLYEVLHGEERDRWPPEARFLEAAHNGDVREIKKIAKELDVQGHGIRTMVTNTTYMGMNALHAAGGGGTDLPSLRPCRMPSCMATFLLSGYYEIVKFLLARGANVHAMSELGTPLMDATLRRFPSIVKILLEHKSDVFLVGD
uniref:Uncharacterized protein n=1 Tax=Aegilops tauschii TaxID=37682 RepID=R7VZJ3_AEGTA